MNDVATEYRIKKRKNFFTNRNHSVIFIPVHRNQNESALRKGIKNENE